MYLGLNPLSMEKRAAFIIAHVKHWYVSIDMLFTGIRGIERSVVAGCFPAIPSTFVDASHDC